MLIKVNLGPTGHVKEYAILGDVDNSIAVEVPDDFDFNKIKFCKVLDGGLIFDQTKEAIVKNSDALRAEHLELKETLKSWDYKTSKHADGDYTDEEWDAIVTERKEMRARIRELEGLLNL